jgi:hypothetical protein
MTSRLTLLLALALFPACAQTSTEPPVFLRLIRNWSRPPGPELIAPYADAKAPITVLGLTSISGFPETWLLETHDSFSSIEDLDQALAPGALAGLAGSAGSAARQDADTTSSRVLIALHLPNFSYRADQAVRNLAKARYFQMSIYRIRPGTESAFAGLVQLRRAGYDSINLDRPEIAYRVLSGDTSGTYVFIAPLASLRMMDNGLARNPAYAEAMSESNARKIAADTVLTRENILLRVRPALSYVPDDFAAADADFWRGRGAR